MKYQVNVNYKLQELFEYEQPSFPIGVWIDDYALMPGHTLNCHWHDSLEFNLVLSGQITYYLNGIQYSVNQGECLFINSNVLHTAQQDKNIKAATVLVIAFHPNIFTFGSNASVFNRYFDIINTSLSGLIINNTFPYSEKIIKCLQNINSLDKTTYGYELKYLSLISDIWFFISKYFIQNTYECNSTKKRYSIGMKQILAYVHEHYREPITVESLSTYLSISKSECFRYFKQFTGTSPIDYINNYRLSQAALLLKNTDNSVTDICIFCGFSTSSYFGKIFKQKYGLSPSQYRNY